MLVVAGRFDKSDSGGVGAWRPHNHWEMNALTHLMQLLCLENCEIKLKTFGNHEYPTQVAIQAIVDNYLHMIVMTASADGQLILLLALLLV